MLEKLFAYFIPPELRAEDDAETYRRARLIVLIPLVSVGPLYALPFYLIGFEEAAIICLLLGGLVTMSPWLLRWLGSLWAVGNLLTAISFLHVVLLIIVTGGLHSVLVPWLVNAVLLALLLAGRRSALGWFVLALATIGVFYGLAYAGVTVPDRIPASAATALVAAIQVSNTLVVFGLAYLFDRETRRVLGVLSQARREAETAADSSRRMAGTLRRQRDRIEEQAERLREMDEAKSEFFANVSHEFRTPLTVALGLLEEWVEVPPGELPKTARRDLRRVLLNNRRLLRLVDQLLDVARLESKSMTLEVRRMDLVGFLEHIAQSFTPLAERRRLTFEHDLPAGPLPVTADPDQLETVVINLLSNAFKFTPEGGSVTLSRERTGEAVSFRVADTGPGIPEDEQDAIFDRFRQAEATRSDMGTGIGLSLARALMERHGGSLVVESTPGEGSTFTARLPQGAGGVADQPNDVTWWEGTEESEARASPAPVEYVTGLSVSHDGWGDETAPQEEPPVEAGGTDERTTVLIVDDNADIRAYVRRHLEPTYRVAEAAGGSAGLARARALTPDCIVSDVMMPGMDGLALLRALRDDPATDFIPVVLLTARATSEDKMAGLDAGADDYLTKPFRPDELHTRIRNLIAQRMRLRERFRAEKRAASGDPPASEAAPDEALAPFLKKVREAVHEHLSEEDFGVSDLAEAVGVSRSKLYRDLNDVSEAAPGELIWQVRLDRARALLRKSEGTISEVAYGVGFKSVSHFTNRFRERFGQPPSALAAATSV